MSDTSNITIHIHGNVAMQNGGTVPAPAVFGLEDVLGAIAQQKPDIIFNTERTYKSGKKAPDGIEIRFGTARPSEATRAVLKEHGYQFSERQKMWYAKDEPKARKLAELWLAQAVEVDTTQYIKNHFWARVKNMTEYDKLFNRTEFLVGSEAAPSFYNTKSALQAQHHVASLIAQRQLSFKKFFNTILEDEEPNNNTSEPNEPNKHIEPNTVTNNNTAPQNNSDQSEEIAQKLEDIANRMQKSIDEKINSATSRQRPTAKRLRVAAGMRQDGYRLQEVQDVLFALAKAHRDGIIKENKYLLHIRNKSQVELLNRYSLALKEQWSNELKQRIFDQNKNDFARLGIKGVFEWSLAEAQKSNLVQWFKGYQGAQQNQREQEILLNQLEQQAWSEKIKGFFPTPKDLIQEMIQWAELEEDHSILEPSAGKGDILDAIAAKFPKQKEHLKACEINHTLRKILTLKGYEVLNNNFLELDPKEYSFDRILMNPPFENGQDIDHVLHAYQLLKPNGRLVAIMSEGVFFRQFKKDKAFRDFLHQKNATISDTIKEAFKNAFNSTGVAVRMLSIDAPTSTQQPNKPIKSTHQSNAPANSTTTKTTPMSDEEELLALEAEAELELLKLRVALEKQKRGLKGLEGLDINHQKLALLRQKAQHLEGGHNDDFSLLDFK